MTNTSIGSLRDFFISVYSRRSFIQGILGPMILMVFIFVALQPTIYTVSGEIIVLSKEIRQADGDPLARTDTTTHLPVTLKDMETEATILRSLPLIQETVAELYREEAIAIKKPVIDTWIKEPIRNFIEPVFATEMKEQEDTDLKIIAGLTTQILAGLHITPLPGSNVITINYETEDIEEGQRIVNRLLDKFLAKRNDLTSGTPLEKVFLTKKKIFQARLKILENKKLDLLKHNQIHHPQEELSLTLNTINTETIQANTLADKLLEARKWQQFLKKVKKNVAASNATTISLPFNFTRGNSDGTRVTMGDDLKQQLELIRNLQAKYDTALLLFNDDNLRVLQPKEQLEMAKIRLLVLIENHLTEQAQYIKVLEAVTVQKRNRLADLKKRAALATEILVQEEEINAERKSIQSSLFKYGQYVDEEHSANLISQEKWRNVRILNYAPIPLGPSSPSKTIVLLAGLIGSLITAISIAFLYELFDHRFHSHMQLGKRFDLPVIAVIDDQRGRPNCSLIQ